MIDINDEENEEIMEYKKVFNFLDKNKRKRITASDAIIGLGALGKICSLKERTKIENEAKLYDLESFINLCQEYINFNEIENNLNSFLRSFESKEKPGYISKQNISFIMKKYDFDRNIKDKKINELIREVSNEYDEHYIKTESLVKEFFK